MITKRKLITILLFILFISTSCMDDDSFWANMYKAPHTTKGLFIINEGNFMYDNASLSYYNCNDKTIINNIFYEANSVALGDVAQSMIIKDTTAFIVVNNSGKIYVINTNTLKIIGKITNLNSPRYIYIINDDKAYITDIYSKSITIINPKSFQTISKIDVNNHNPKFYQHPTEQMVKYKQYIYTNCWSYDNKILIIDTNIDKVIDSIEVGIQPNSLVIDKYNKLWVLCDGGYKGNPYGYEKAKLLKINLDNNQIEQVFNFEIDDDPSKLIINSNKDSLFFINKHIYRHIVTNNTAPEIIVKSKNINSSSYYGLGIDPNNSDLYVADALDKVQPGIIYRYSSNLTPIDSFKVGIIPSFFCFNTK